MAIGDGGHLKHRGGKGKASRKVRRKRNTRGGRGRSGTPKCSDFPQTSCWGMVGQSMNCHWCDTPTGGFCAAPNQDCVDYLPDSLPYGPGNTYTCRTNSDCNTTGTNQGMVCRGGRCIPQNAPQGNPQNLCLQDGDPCPLGSSDCCGTLTCQHDQNSPTTGSCQQYYTGNCCVDGYQCPSPFQWCNSNTCQCGMW